MGIAGCCHILRGWSVMKVWAGNGRDELDLVAREFASRTGGAPRVVFDFTVADGRITAIEMLADPDLLSDLNLEMR